MTTLEEQLRAFLAERFLFNAGEAIDPAASLLKAGILDSTGVLEVVMFIEDTFGVSVADEELVAENFDTIRGMARLIKSKTPANVRA